MARAVVKQEIAVPAETLWTLVADFGNVAWIPGGQGAEVEGRGPGMLRILQGPKGEIRERLESADPATRTLVYSITQGIPLPVKSYRSTIKVSAAGKGRSQLEWSCEAEPDGVTEQEAVKAIEGVYGLMIGWIRSHLGAGA
jgi:hypothetical protein